MLPLSVRESGSRGGERLFSYKQTPQAITDQVMPQSSFDVADKACAGERVPVQINAGLCFIASFCIFYLPPSKRTENADLKASSAPGAFDVGSSQGGMVGRKGSEAAPCRQGSCAASRRRSRPLFLVQDKREELCMLLGPRLQSMPNLRLLRPRDKRNGQCDQSVTSTLTDN